MLRLCRVSFILAYSLTLSSIILQYLRLPSRELRLRLDAFAKQAILEITDVRGFIIEATAIRSATKVPAEESSVTAVTY